MDGLPLEASCVVRCPCPQKCEKSIKVTTANNAQPWILCPVSLAWYERSIELNWNYTQWTETNKNLITKCVTILYFQNHTENLQKNLDDTVCNNLCIMFNDICYCLIHINKDEQCLIWWSDVFPTIPLECPLDLWATLCPVSLVWN